MKKIALMVALLFVLRFVVRADTINFCHVYYNDIKICEFTNYGQAIVIPVKANNIKDKDSITVRYFRDTPCRDCGAIVTVADTTRNLTITTGKGQGTFGPVSFSLKKLLNYQQETGVNYFAVSYSEGLPSTLSSKPFNLFEIILK